LPPPAAPPPPSPAAAALAVEPVVLTSPEVPGERAPGIAEVLGDKFDGAAVVDCEYIVLVFAALPPVSGLKVCAIAGTAISGRPAAAAKKNDLKAVTVKSSCF
jgi:hypothetical protein